MQANTESLAPVVFKPWCRLVKLVGRVFYDDIYTESKPKAGRCDNHGLCVVILDALTRRQWVREEDLALALKLQPKQLRRTLRFLQEEMLVRRCNRKETTVVAKKYNAAVAVVGVGEQVDREDGDRMKLHTHSYCCLDYAQIYDVVRYRIHQMKKKLSDMGSRNTVPEYVCHNCRTSYSVYDFDRLLCPADGNIYCEKLNCKGEVVESDKLAAGKMGVGDDDAIRRCEKLKGMLQKMEEQLKPLQEQLDRVRDLSVPDFGTLHDWEIRVHTASRRNGDSISNESSKSSLAHGGTTMPYIGETGVEVDLVGIKIKGEHTEDIKPTTQKVLPPWMIKEGMNLTKEQSGEAKTESNLDHNLILVEEKKPNVDTEDKKSIQEAFAREYYAALIKRQEEAAAKRCYNVLKAVDDSSERQDNMKSKRENNDNDYIEWEEAIPEGKSNTSPSLKRAAHSDVESEDDEIEWVEG